MERAIPEAFFSAAAWSSKKPSKLSMTQSSQAGGERTESGAVAMNRFLSSGAPMVTDRGPLHRGPVDVRGSTSFAGSGPRGLFVAAAARWAWCWCRRLCRCHGFVLKTTPVSLTRFCFSCRQLILGSEGRSTLNTRLEADLECWARPQPSLKRDGEPWHGAHDFVRVGVILPL